MSVTDQWWLDEDAPLRRIASDDRPETDRHAVTATDRESEWLERELYDQDSERWETEE